MPEMKLTLEDKWKVLYFLGNNDGTETIWNIDSGTMEG